MERPTSDERSYGAQGGGHVIPQEERLSAPESVNYGSRIVAVGSTLVGAAAIVGGIGMGIQESHTAGREHAIADATYSAATEKHSIQLERESHQHAAAADNWRTAGWLGGISTISLGVYAAGRLRKKEQAANEGNHADYLARVKAHLASEQQNNGA